ncbi:MAG: hypothetical protein K0S51_2258 [Bacillales bacterium]|jgi:hypothetical protein|nr:hypothetical protein [Bacillales bacterium]
MRGLLINEREVREIEYLLKREMDEILFDLKDNRISQVVKTTLYDRYDILFKLFTRVSTPKQIQQYIPTKATNFYNKKKKKKC